MDYANPDYTAIFVKRAEKLARIRGDKKLLAACKVHYAEHPWDFVSDWGMTFEPRNIEKGLIAEIPFVLWERQVEYLKWVYERWQLQERGIVEKSRDCGVTWLTVGFAASMWCNVPGFVTGLGSRKEELVDKIGDDKAIFSKLRFFISRLPVEFLPPGYVPRTHSAHMKLINPDTGSAVIGEAGDNIGRGGRSSVYFVDEAAFVERQDYVDAALSQTTNCQIDISTPNGNGNAFYRKRQRFDGTDRVFVFDWRDDPRKDDAWYQRQVAEQTETTVAQEIDRDYNASQEDSFIPAQWIAASIDAHVRLGFDASGLRVTGFDPADIGDAKALVHRWGSIIVDAETLSKGDVTQAVPWAFHAADQFRADVLRYDGDGMGAPVMKMALDKGSAGRFKVEAYHGSGEVQDKDQFPDGDKGGKTNRDMYLNYRAQSWSQVRARFEATYNAVQRANEGKIVNGTVDNMVSLSSECKEIRQLQAELSRPMRIFSNNGKIQVESKAHMKKRGVQSPNLADALVIALSAKRPPKRKPRIHVPARRMLDSAVGY